MVEDVRGQTDEDPDLANIVHFMQDVGGPTLLLCVSFWMSVLVIALVGKENSVVSTILRFLPLGTSEGSRLCQESAHSPRLEKNYRARI